MSNALLIRRRGMMMAASAPVITNFPRFTALTNGSTVEFHRLGTSAPNFKIEYSVNGAAFTDYTLNTVLTIDSGEYVEFRQKEGYSFQSIYAGISNRLYFLLTGSVEFSGDITKILNINGERNIGTNGLRRLFYDQAALTGDMPLINCETLGQYALYDTFYNCSNVTSFHFTTINDSINIFYGCNGCVSFTIDADSPPVLNNSSITGLKSDCAIYVPAGSVAAYQAAQYWSARAAYIQANPNT